MSEDIEGIEKEIEVELSRINVSSFEADDPDTELSDVALSDSETVSIQGLKVLLFLLESSTGTGKPI